MNVFIALKGSHFWFYIFLSSKHAYMYIGPLALAFVLYVQILKAILYRFEYTTPVLSLWYSRCSDMQMHRAILHLFEYTTLFCPCDIADAAICKGIGRYCTFLKTQHQFCPCDISDAAICNDKGDIAPFWIHNTSFVLVIYQMQQYATF